MGEVALAYEASCYSIGVPGRSVCNARDHHWVAENTGGEAVGAGEMFCGSIAACAVNMVENHRQQGKPRAGRDGRQRGDVPGFRQGAGRGFAL